MTTFCMGVLIVLVGCLIIAMVEEKRRLSDASDDLHSAIRYARERCGLVVKHSTHDHEHRPCVLCGLAVTIGVDGGEFRDGATTIAAHNRCVSGTTYDRRKRHTTGGGR